MYRDARSLANDSRLRADICIVGAGPAGLSLAHTLADHRVRILIVESGDVFPRDATQRLGDGRVHGHSYYPLEECRLRAVGGTSGAWGGWCRPLEAIDFERRAWLPGSGWPFRKDDLRPHYERAQTVCLLGRYDYDEPRDALDEPSPASHEHFRNTVFHIRPTRFGELYGAPLRQTSRVDVLLNATVLELMTDAGGRRVAAVRGATLAGNQFSVSADVFVLASGGIENARLLLCSRSRDVRGIGNEYDLVGRYFNDHMHVPLGTLRTRDGIPEFFQSRAHGDVSTRGVMCLAEEYQRQHHALGLAITLHDAEDPHDLFSLGQAKPGYRSLQALLHPVKRRQRPERALRHLRTVATHLPEVGRLVYRRYVRTRSGTALLGCRAEQAPNAESRITLGSDVDVFGVPKPRLDWRLVEADLANIERAQALAADALGADAVELFPIQGARGDGKSDEITAGAHHMGTTRMHDDARYGVVDANCRVHTVANLYVAGSSVFPTGGWAPPTLTIVALALRLADHLLGGVRDVV